MNNNIIHNFIQLINYYKILYYNNQILNNDISSISFKLKAFQTSLNIIKHINIDLTNENNIKELLKYKGIGKGTVERIKEINTTGKLKEIVPIVKINNNNELSSVYGIKKLTKYYNLGIYTFKDLELYNNKYPNKLNNNVKLGIKYYNLLQYHIKRSEMIKHKKLLKDILKNIDKNLIIKICGSYRRKNNFSNDIDCIITKLPNKTNKNDTNVNYLDIIIKKLIDIKYITDEITKNRNKKVFAFCTSIDKNYNFNNNIIRRIDIYYVPYDEYPCALMYFTGDKYFNLYFRKYVKDKGYKLNEHGLYKKENDKFIKLNIKSERDIFKTFNMEYINPSDRQYNKYI